MKLDGRVLSDLLEHSTGKKVAYQEDINLHLDSDGIRTTTSTSEMSAIIKAFYPWPEGKRPEDAPVEVALKAKEALAGLKRLGDGEVDIEFNGAGGNRTTIKNGSRKFSMIQTDTQFAPSAKFKKFLPPVKFTLDEEAIDNLRADMRALDLEFAARLQASGNTVNLNLASTKTSSTLHSELDFPGVEFPEVASEFRYPFCIIMASEGPVEVAIGNNCPMRMKYSTETGVQIDVILAPVIPDGEHPGKCPSEAD